MTMNKIIFALLITAASFAITVLIYNFHGIQVQDSLIQAFLSLVAAELAIMGTIQVTKTRREKKKKEEEINE